MPDPTIKTAQQQRSVLADRLEGLPASLQVIGPWYTWRYQHDDRREPIRKVADSSTLGEFRSVLDSLRAPSSVASGIGFELGASLNLVVVTLRGAFQRRRVENTRRLVDGFSSYAERSLDGEDLQIFMRGHCRSFEQVSPWLDIDVSCGPRFVICTGKHESTAPSAVGLADRAMLESLRQGGARTNETRAWR